MADFKKFKEKHETVIQFIKFSLISMLAGCENYPEADCFLFCKGKEIGTLHARCRGFWYTVRCLCAQSAK